MQNKISENQNQMKTLFKKKSLFMLYKFNELFDNLETAFVVIFKLHNKQSNQVLFCMKHR